MAPVTQKLTALVAGVTSDQATFIPGCRTVRVSAGGTMLGYGHASPLTLVARLAAAPAFFMQGHESWAAVLGKPTPSPSIPSTPPPSIPPPSIPPAPTDPSLLMATWLTGLATAGLFLGAIVTAIYAVMTYRAQKREINLMGQQRDEQRALTRQQVDLLQLQAQALRGPRAAARPSWIARRLASGFRLHAAGRLALDAKSAFELGR
jgi:hypothetical protein